MYESFFQLKQRPFAAAPRIDRYFPGAAIEASRVALSRCIEGAQGAGLLIGAAGTGKTLLCHLLGEQFRSQFAVALLSNGHLDSRRELLQAILFELGLPYRRLEEGELRLSLIDYVSNDQNARSGLLLLVDEAHTLSPRLLEEVRLIANLVRNGQPRVRLILAGNPSLEECLADPTLEAFNQRIATRCYLATLDHAQTQHYVQAQMTALGVDALQVFTPDALEAVYRATDGVPRLINQVCDHVLMLAFAGGHRRIDRAGVEEAWSDLQQLPTAWTETARTAARSEAASGNFIEFGDLHDEPHTMRDDGPPLDERFFSPAGHMGPAAEATLLIHQIDDHLSELDRDFVVPPPPRAHESRRDWSANPANPFDERFDEEELLVDRYTSLVPGENPSVKSGEGRELADLLEPFTHESPELTVIAPQPDGDSELSFACSARHQEWSQSAVVDSLSAFSASTCDVAAAIDWHTAEDAFAPLGPSADDWSEASAVPLVMSRAAPLAGSIEENRSLDDDLMIVEDDPRAEIYPRSPPPRQQVRRQEYRQLFSSLRRG